MPATVDAITDATAVEKSAVTFDYGNNIRTQAKKAGVEKREERRQAEAPGSFVDAQHDQEPVNAQDSVWVEAHAALAQK